MRSRILRWTLCGVCAALVLTTTPCLEGMAPAARFAGTVLHHAAAGAAPPCHGEPDALLELEAACPCGCSDVVETGPGSGPMLPGIPQDLARGERGFVPAPGSAAPAAGPPSSIDHVPIPVAPTLT